MPTLSIPILSLFGALALAPIGLVAAVAQVRRWTPHPAGAWVWAAVTAVVPYLVLDSEPAGAVAPMVASAALGASALAYGGLALLRAGPARRDAAARVFVAGALAAGAAALVGTTWMAALSTPVVAAAMCAAYRDRNREIVADLALGAVSLQLGADLLLAASNAGTRSIPLPPGPLDGAAVFAAVAALRFRPLVAGTIAAVGTAVGAMLRAPVVQGILAVWRFEWSVGPLPAIVEPEAPEDGEWTSWFDPGTPRDLVQGGAPFSEVTPDDRVAVRRADGTLGLLVRWAVGGRSIVVRRLADGTVSVAGRPAVPDGPAVADELRSAVAHCRPEVMEFDDPADWTVDEVLKTCAAHQLRGCGMLGGLSDPEARCEWTVDHGWSIRCPADRGCDGDDIGPTWLVGAGVYMTVWSTESPNARVACPEGRCSLRIVHQSTVPFVVSCLAGGCAVHVDAGPVHVDCGAEACTVQCQNGPIRESAGSFDAHCAPDRSGRRR